MKVLLWILTLGLASLVACSGGDRQAGQADAADTTRLRIEDLNRLIAQDQGNADLLNQRARYFLVDRQLDKALQDVHKAITIDGNRPAYYITLSEIYLLMGLPDQARDALLSSLSRNPDDTDVLVRLAKVYLIVQDYAKCYETIDRALAADNSCSPAYYTRAISLLEQGDTLKAVSDLKKAVDINQSYYEAYVQLGELYAMKKDPAAELYFQHALSQWPTSREALYNLGLFYQETGRYEKAIQTYQSLSKTDSTSREAWYNTGYIYLVYLNDYPKAVEFFSGAIRLDPAYHEAWYNRGYGYELQGDYTSAAEDYHQALKVKVNYDKAIEGLNRLDRIRMGR